MDLHVAEILQSEPMAEIPPNMLQKLHDYQRRSLHKMLEIEKTPQLELKYGAVNFMGGVVCDQVGMGKSALIIGLVMASKDFSRGSDGARTLVICPTHLVAQWKEEFAKFSDPHDVPVFTITGKFSSSSRFCSVRVAKLGDASNNDHISYNPNYLSRGIADAQVVVMALEFFCGNHYTWLRRHKWREAPDQMAQWRRVVYDECHQVSILIMAQPCPAQPCPQHPQPTATTAARGRIRQTHGHTLTTPTGGHARPQVPLPLPQPPLPARVVRQRHALPPPLRVCRRPLQRAAHKGVLQGAAGVMAGGDHADQASKGSRAMAKPTGPAKCFPAKTHRQHCNRHTSPAGTDLPPG